MADDFDAARKEAEGFLGQGDAGGAFRRFRWWVEYPQLTTERWQPGLELFARVTEELIGAPLAERVRAAAVKPGDVAALYQLGYDLIEAGVPGIAASVLARANAEQPGREDVVCELVAALESNLQPELAVAVLRGHPDLLDRSFIARYLLAFNAVMSGDRETPRRLLLTLDPAGDDERAYLRRTVEGMVARGDAIDGVAKLDRDDLRGWHYVMNGGLLLHESPHGRESMRGRYAWVQDTDALCREGLARVKAVLEVWDAQPPRVFALGDRDSTILGQAAARVLGVPFEAWPVAGRTEPALVVAYDLGGAPEGSLAALAEHRPGQVLWTHAACWTAGGAFAPDLVTFLYQTNTSPWEEAHETPEELATHVADAQPDAGALADIDALKGLARAVRGSRRTSGPRGKQWLGSPVKSARFA